MLNLLLGCMDNHGILNRFRFRMFMEIHKNLVNFRKQGFGAKIRAWHYKSGASTFFLTLNIIVFFNGI